MWTCICTHKLWKGKRKSLLRISRGVCQENKTYKLQQSMVKVVPFTAMMRIAFRLNILHFDETADLSDPKSGSMAAEVSFISNGIDI